MAHVGDVGDEAHLVALVEEVAPQDVVDHGTPGVAQVGVGVDRGAADVDPHVAGDRGLKGHFAARQGVVDDQAHRAIIGPVA